MTIVQRISVDAIASQNDFSVGSIDRDANTRSRTIDRTDDQVISIDVAIDAEGNVSVVEGLEIDPYTRDRIVENIDDLQGERSAVAELL